MTVSNDELVKWACLFECLYNVNKRCKKNGVDIDYVLKKKLKPNVIDEYIRGRFPIMCNQLETGEYAGEFINEFLFDGKD